MVNTDIAGAKPMPSALTLLKLQEAVELGRRLGVRRPSGAGGTMTRPGWRSRRRTKISATPNRPATRNGIDVRVEADGGDHRVEQERHRQQQQRADAERNGHQPRHGQAALLVGQHGRVPRQQVRRGDRAEHAAEADRRTASSDDEQRPGDEPGCRADARAARGRGRAARRSRRRRWSGRAGCRRSDRAGAARAAAPCRRRAAARPAARR